MEILLSEAEKWVKPKRSKIYDDARKGILSTKKDTRRGNRKVVDTAELQRVYGNIQNPQNTTVDSNTHDNARPQIDTSTLIENLEDQVKDLKEQLKIANEREKILIEEKTKILNLFANEQKKTEQLMITTTQKTTLWNRIFNTKSINTNQKILSKTQK